MASLIDEHEFEQAQGVCDGQVSLACCSPWGHKESEMTEQLNWTKLKDFTHMEKSFLYLSYYDMLLLIHTLQKNTAFP